MLGDDVELVQCPFKMNKRVNYQHQTCNVLLGVNCIWELQVNFLCDPCFYEMNGYQQKCCFEIKSVVTIHGEVMCNTHLLSVICSV